MYDYFRNTPESEHILEKILGLSDWWNEMSGRASLQKTPPLPG